MEGATEFCSESLLSASSRQVRQEELGGVNPEWGGADGWRLVRNNNEDWMWENDNNYISWARLGEYHCS